MFFLSRTLIERAAAIGLTLLAALFLTGGLGRRSDARDAGVRLAQAAPQAQAATFRIGALIVTAPWIRATPDGAKVAGGFMTITNTGTVSDTLVGGSFPLAGRVEVHEMATNAGVMSMREVAGGLEIKPGETVELRPGGFHVMFMDLRERVAAGGKVKGALVFKRAGTLEIDYAVAPIGARTAPGN